MSMSMPMPMPMPILRADQLVLRLGARTLLQQADLTLQAGQMYGLLGANGVGKTTLIRTLAGLQPASAGQILLQGQPLSALGAMQRARLRAVLLQQDDSVFWGSTLDYVLLGGNRGNRGNRDINRDNSNTLQARALDLLQELELERHAAADLRQLSGGERQRARLAQTLLQGSPLLLLDEPLTHLDLRQQALVLAALRRRVDAGACVLLSLHEPALARHSCEQVVFLYDQARFDRVREAPLHSGLRAGPAPALLTPTELQLVYDCQLDADLRPVHAGLVASPVHSSS
jgi:iron complex transport system ATP-binding protein